VTITVRVQAEDFDPGTEASALTTGTLDVGAVVTFVGLCRAENGRLKALELEHFPGMAEAELSRVAGEAAERWPLSGVTVVHRHGLIPAGGRIVLVAAASTHRRAAFDAAEFLMDFLKTRAPFWKREHLANGTLGPWVEADAKDAAAAGRWV
jgi:molybdopterin synthase catalytic subunit